MRRLPLVVAALVAAPLLAQPASASSTSCHLERTDHVIHTPDFDITYPTYRVVC